MGGPDLGRNLSLGSAGVLVGGSTSGGARFPQMFSPHPLLTVSRCASGDCPGEVLGADCRAGILMGGYEAGGRSGMTFPQTFVQTLAHPLSSESGHA